MSDVLLMQGDCLEKLKTVPDSSVHLVIAIELDDEYFKMCQHRAVVPVQKELI